MRVMVIVKATKNSEAARSRAKSSWPTWGSSTRTGEAPASCSRGEGLHPELEGQARDVRGRKKDVWRPFAETKELIAGFWLWQVKSMEEAMEWLKRCSDPMPGEESIIEVRPVFEAEDFGKEFTPELRKQDESCAGRSRRASSSLRRVSCAA